MELGIVGVSREDYNVVKYGRDGLYVHVLRLQEGKKDTWQGLDGSWNEAPHVRARYAE